ncbi:hypothetical protein, partial [Fischerella thermalis]
LILGALGVLAVHHSSPFYATPKSKRSLPHVILNHIDFDRLRDPNFLKKVWYLAFATFENFKSSVEYHTL